MAQYDHIDRTSVEPRRTISIAQALALITGVVLMGIGIAGFFETDLEEWDDFAHHATGDELLGFELNAFHNVVHLVLGGIGLVAWMRLRSSIAYGIFLAVGYGAVFVYGLFAVDETWNVLSLNHADNWLHLALAALGVVIAAIGTAELTRQQVPDDNVEIDLRAHVPEDATATPPPIGQYPGGTIRR
jgi:hypothetical protein